MIEIVESWRIVDKWWTPEGRIEREYTYVNWDGSLITFVRQTFPNPDPVWRIYKQDDNRENSLQAD